MGIFQIFQKTIPELYQIYLLPNEKVELAADLGSFITPNLYVVIATNLRMIVIKKFPKNVIELEYKDLEVVEHYTNVEWLMLIYSFFLGLLSWLFFLNRDAILQKVGIFMPPVEPLLYSGDFFRLNAGSFFALAVLFCAVVYFFGLFALSLFGQFRVLIFEQAPIQLTSALTPDLQQLMKLIESKKRMFRKVSE